MEDQLQDYLYNQIPLSKSLGIRVHKASPEEVILTAPFEKNINHKKTVFGGSLHAVATLACWSLIYLNLKNEPEKYEIVITKSEIEYKKPVVSDFSAISSLPESAIWNRFRKMLQQRGKGRITMIALVNDAVFFYGTFGIITINREKDSKVY